MEDEDTTSPKDGSSTSATANDGANDTVGVEPSRQQNNIAGGEQRVGVGSLLLPMEGERVGVGSDSEEIIFLPSKGDDDDEDEDNSSSFHHGGRRVAERIAILESRQQQQWFGIEHGNNSHSHPNNSNGQNNRNHHQQQRQRQPRDTVGNLLETTSNNGSSSSTGNSRMGGQRLVPSMAVNNKEKHNTTTNNRDDDDDDDDDNQSDDYSEDEQPGAFRINGSNDDDNDTEVEDDERHQNDTNRYYNHPDNNVSTLNHHHHQYPENDAPTSTQEILETFTRPMTETTIATTLTNNNSFQLEEEDVERVTGRRTTTSSSSLLSPLPARLVDEQAEKKRYMAETEQEIRDKILSETVTANAISSLMVDTTSGGNHYYYSNKDRGDNNDGDGNQHHYHQLDASEKRLQWIFRGIMILIVALGVGVGIYLARRTPSPMGGRGGGGSIYYNSMAPINDVCEEAISLIPNDRPVFNTTNGATVETNLAVSNNVTANDSTRPWTTTTGVCPPNLAHFSSLRGLWYTVQGTGLPLQASTCYRTNFDTQIVIFSGTNCDALDCIAYNDNGPADYCGSSLESSVTWSTRIDEIYHILIAGSNEEDGTFGLQVIETVENDVCETSIGPLSTNGRPVIGSTDGATWETNSNAMFERCRRDTGGGNVNDPIREEENKPSDPGRGIWYHVLGTGRPLVASTCHDGTTLNTQISIFRGSCGMGNSSSQLDCMETNDNDNYACPQHPTASSVTWATQFDELYWILVHGRDNAVGEFVLTLSESVSNDLCEMAQNPLLDESDEDDNIRTMAPTTTINATATNIMNDTLSDAETMTSSSSSSSSSWVILRGSTRNATIEDDFLVPLCSSNIDGEDEDEHENGFFVSSPLGPGIWYEIPGNGKYWTATFVPRCSKWVAASKPLPKLSVYRGGSGGSSCENLSCQPLATTKATMTTVTSTASLTAEIKGACRIGSATPVWFWHAVNGEMYHILVQDYWSYWRQVVSSSSTMSNSNRNDNDDNDGDDDALGFTLILNQITPGVSCNFPIPLPARPGSIRHWTGSFPSPTASMLTSNNTSTEMLEENSMLLDCIATSSDISSSVGATTNGTQAEIPPWVMDATTTSVSNDTATTLSRAILWHSIVGTGTTIQVSASCANRLAVYTGNCQDKGSLKCVVLQGEDPCEQPVDQVENWQSFQWLSVKGEMYRIVISSGGSIDGDPNATAPGSDAYSLTIEVLDSLSPVVDGGGTRDYVQSSSNLIMVAALVFAAVVLLVVCPLLVVWHRHMRRMAVWRRHDIEE